MIGQEHDQKILEKSTGNDWSRTWSEDIRKVNREWLVKNMIRRDEKSQQGMIGQEHDQKILEKSTGNDWSRTWSEGIRKVDREWLVKNMIRRY
jgi:hypothetical protein